MAATEYFQIRSEQDMGLFLDRVNGLHDGYIIGVHYEHRGHSGGNPHWIDPESTELILRVMVTSIYDAVVELVFQSVYEWQILNDGSDIIEASLLHRWGLPPVDG